MVPAFGSTRSRIEPCPLVDRASGVSWKPLSRSVIVKGFWLPLLPSAEAAAPNAATPTAPSAAAVATTPHCLSLFMQSS